MHLTLRPKLPTTPLRSLYFHIRQNDVSAINIMQATGLRGRRAVGAVSSSLEIREGFTEVTVELDLKGQEGFGHKVAHGIPGGGGGWGVGTRCGVFLASLLHWLTQRIRVKPGLSTRSATRRGKAPHRRFLTG